ncbi:metal-chelation protein CHAD [Ralstonia solanacearum]|uniref:CHAD domain-containing protein n=1 Tax=Ralstonia solanacearum TaxID=305 RepID=UPI0005AC9842|nr:CHAD domain-containing protein [Ralstonia solanacearum]OAI65193.1 metal-chelation protein CHAD [Ralstonia solanacearum]
MSKRSPSRILSVFAGIVLEQIEALREALAKLAAPAPTDEDLHQYRVSLRRLRSAWVTFAPVLPVALVAVWKPRLRELAAATGPVREWDVLLLDWLPAARAAVDPADTRSLNWLGRAATKASAARRRAWAALRTELVSPGLAAMLDALRDVIEPFHDEVPSSSLRAFAHSRARVLRKKVLKRGRKPKHAPAAELHRARIAAKQWRYLYESFYPALGAHASKRRCNHLRSLQDALGEIHDADASLARLAEAAGIEPPVAIAALFHARAEIARAHAARQLQWVRARSA